MKRVLLAVVAILLIGSYIFGIASLGVIGFGKQVEHNKTVPELNAMVTLTLRDCDGVLEYERSFRSESYVSAMIHLLYVQGAGTSLATLDTSNTSRTLCGTGSNSQKNLCTTAAGGVVVTGIVCGSGSSAVSITDYAVGTLITEGTGAGQLNYGAQSFTAPATTGSTRYFVQSRVMTNNSAGAVTVNEVGLYALGCTSWYFMLTRDLTGGLSVGVGKTLTVAYTISVTA